MLSNLETAKTAWLKMNAGEAVAKTVEKAMNESCNQSGPATAAKPKPDWPQIIRALEFVTSEMRKM